jgi:hypothetical protein
MGSVGWAQKIPVTPVPKASGISNIEQRYVYAPPDKGEFDVPLITGLVAPKEVLLEEPIMCSPQAQANVHVSYDKSQNSVKFIADFKKALPYRMSYTRPVDISTPYNQFPVSVQDGKWQLWFARPFGTESIFYYSGTTLKLLGNENSFPGGPPPGAIAVSLPVIHLICSPIFEGDPEGNAHVEFDLAYDHMLDGIGNGGSYAIYLPYDLCKPDEYGAYYLPGGLPASKAMSWDDVLQNIWSGYGIAFSSSLEPDPKPSYLDSRDNLMIGWGNQYPQVWPRGTTRDTLAGTAVNRTSCGTQIMAPFPQAYFNLCGP